jgi:hypothetical protein
VGVVRIVERDVVHAHAARLQRAGKMPHGGEHKDQLFRVMLHVGAFGLHLGQQHHIPRRIQIPQRRDARRELVAEDDPEGARRHQPCFPKYRTAPHPALLEPRHDLGTVAICDSFCSCATPSRPGMTLPRPTMRGR